MRPSTSSLTPSGTSLTSATTLTLSENNMKYDVLDHIEDGDPIVPKSRRDRARQLAMFRNSSEEWMRELARQVDDGILPHSVLDTLPREMRVKS